MPIYEYQGQHYDIETNDPNEAKSKIIAHLGGNTQQDISDIEAGFSKLLESSEKKSASDVADEFSKRSVPQQILRGIGGTVAALPEMGLQGLTSVPSMATNILSRFAGGAKGLIENGTITGKDLEEGYIPDALKPVAKATEAIAYQPRTAVADLASRGLMEGIKATGRGIGAAAQAAWQGTGQTGAQQLMDDKSAIIPAATSLAFDTAATIFGAKDALRQAKDLKNRYIEVTDTKGSTSHDAIQAKIDALIAEEKAKESTGSLPELPDAPPLVPGSWKEGFQPKPEGETPLPVLPDELKPLSEQYPKEVPIGAAEVTLPAPKDTTPLPKLPPEDRGLLSTVDYEAGVPDTQRLATRHDVPTVDFPLRQEVLERPEIQSAIEAFRSEADRLQTVLDHAIDPRAKAKAKVELENLQNEFAAGMKQLGIDNAAEAHGLNRPLYEGGKGETKLPIQKGRQGGYINPAVFVEGFKKAKDLVERGLRLEAAHKDGALLVSAFDRKTGDRVGGAYFEPKDLGVPLTKTDLISKATGISKDFRGRGIATEMYKFVSELGNDIQPSNVRTAGGRGLWNGLEAKGIASGGKINRGTFGQSGAVDPSVFLRMFPKFRGTRVADINGRPLPVYHGTTNRGKPSNSPITSFKTPTGHILKASDYSSKVSRIYPGDIGVWHGSSPEIANTFSGTKSNTTGGTVYESYINLQNPKVFSTHREFLDYVKSFERQNKTANYVRRQLIKEGYDGIQINESMTDGVGARTDYITFRPDQIEPTSGASKLGGVGKKEGGAWAPFSSKEKTPSYDEFKKKYGRNGSISDSILTKAYEETYGKTPDANEVAKTNQVLSTLTEESGKAKLLGPKYTGEIIPNEKFIPAVRGIPDANPGLLSQWMASAGRLQKELFNHPVTTQMYNIVTKHIEEANLAARRILDDSNTGIFNIYRKSTVLDKGGYEQFKEYFKWRHENQGNVELPSHFNKAVQEFHSKETAFSSDLFNKMKEVASNRNLSRAQELANHLIHMWDGPYRAYVSIKDAHGNSRIITYIAEKSPGLARKAVEYHKKNFPEYEISPVTFVESSVRNKSAMFDHLMELAETKDPFIKDSLDKYIERREASQENYLQQQNRFKVRSGKGGFMGNKPWLSERQNFKETLQALRTKYDAGYEWIAMQKIKSEFGPLLKAQAEGTINVPNAIALGQRYHDHAFGLRSETSAVTKAFDAVEKAMPLANYPRRAINEISRIAGTVTIPYLLAYKMGTLVQGVVQPITVIPRLMKLANEGNSGYLHAGTAWAHGAVDGIHTLMDMVTFGKSSEFAEKLMSPESKAIHKYMVDNDISRMSLMDDSPFFGEGGRITNAGNIAMSALFKGGMSVIEGPTRGWAFSAMARKFMSDGMPINEALKLAHEQMDVMVNYNKEASAMIHSELGLAGHETKGLHTFMQNYYTQLAVYTKDAISGIKRMSPKESAPLAMYLLQSFAFAGAMGFIGADVAEFLTDIVRKSLQGTRLDSRELQEFSPHKWMLENLPDYISAGPVAAGLGLGTQGYFNSKVIDPSRTFLENLVPKTMASLEIAKGVAKLPKLAMEDTSRIEKGNILEAVLPKAATPAIRSRFSEKGPTVLNRSEFKQGLPMYQRTPKEQAFADVHSGIKSLSESLNTDQAITQNAADKRVDDSVKLKKQQFDNVVISAFSDPTKKELLQRKAKELTTRWGVDPNTLDSRIQTLASEYGIPDSQTRRVLILAGQGYGSIGKLQSAIKTRNKMLERQGK